MPFHIMEILLNSLSLDISLWTSHYVVVIRRGFPLFVCMEKNRGVYIPLRYVLLHRKKYS